MILKILKKLIKKHAINNGVYPAYIYFIIKLINLNQLFFINFIKFKKKKFHIKNEFELYLLN